MHISSKIKMSLKLKWFLTITVLRLSWSMMQSTFMFYPAFQLLQAFSYYKYLYKYLYKFSRIFVISLQMLIKLFSSNRAIYILYHLNKYILIYSTKYTKIFWIGLFSSTQCNRLHEKMLEVFGYPSNNRVFYRPELNL